MSDPVGEGTVSEPSAAAVAVPPETGGDAPTGPTAASPEVGRALAELDSLGELDLGEHADAYQRIHVELQGALASIDDA